MSKKRPFRSGIVGIADQSVIAVTNLLLTFFAAQGGVDSLGSFALVAAVYFAVLVMIRALVAEPYMALGDRDSEHLYGSLTIISCVLGAVLGGVVSAFVFPSPTLLLLVPALILCLGFYELARIKAYTMGRTGSALAGTCLIFVVVGVAGILDHSSGPDKWIRLTVYWLLAGMLGYLLILARTGGMPKIHKGAWCWFRSHLYPQGKHLALDALGTVLVAHVCLFLISQVGSLSQVAAVRATTTLLSPVSLVFTGLTLSLTPALARADAAGARRTLRVFWALVFATSLIATIVVCLFGAQLIDVFFGPSAVPSEGTLLVAVSSVVMFSLGSPLLAQVRVRQSYLRIAIVRFITGVLIVFVIMAAAKSDLGMLFFLSQFGQALLIFAAAHLVLRPMHREPSGRHFSRG